MPDTPFRTPPTALDPAWFDFNGHLNMAYYNVLFDKALDLLFDALGCGESYRRDEDRSFFTAEAHVTYLREIKPGSEVYVELTLLDHDSRRLHLYGELHHRDGWLSAASEILMLHIDMTGPRVTAIPQALESRIAALEAAHAALPRSDYIGRSIGIRRR